MLEQVSKHNILKNNVYEMLAINQVIVRLGQWFEETVTPIALFQYPVRCLIERLYNVYNPWNWVFRPWCSKSFWNLASKHLVFQRVVSWHVYMVANKQVLSDNGNNRFISDIPHINKVYIDYTGSPENCVLQRVQRPRYARPECSYSIRYHWGTHIQTCTESTVAAQRAPA